MHPRLERNDALVVAFGVVQRDVSLSDLAIPGDLGRRWLCKKLKKRGHGSWYFARDIDSDIPGRRERIRRGGCATRGDAARALARVRTPDGAARGVATVGQWLTAWSDSRIRLRANTARSYQSIIEHYLIPHLGRIPLTN